MTPPLTIRPVCAADAGEWRRLRALLWPDDGDEHAADIARFFAGDALASCPGGQAVVFVAARADGRLGGFVEAGLRPFADGCDGRPVGYVEGWFVDADLRRYGVGAALLRAAEAWAKGQGVREMASDCEVDNDVSRRAHLAVGYGEVERVIRFVKRL